MYDLIIVGAGLAGLYAALKNKHKRILVLEAEKRAGGRIHTVYKPWQHEAGAGRIHISHKRVLELFSHYGIEISKAVTIEPAYVSLDKPDQIQTNTFVQDIKPIIKEIRLMGADAARKTTIATVAAAKFPALWRQLRYKYPYSGELFVANAWEGACAIENTMTIRDGWVFSKDGNETLIDCMMADLSGIVHLGEPVLSVSSGKKWIISTSHSTYETAAVLITSRKAAAIIVNPPAAITALIERTVTKPMVRVYAKWPAGPCWFEGIPSFTTDAKLRYFIAGSDNHAMISYVDAIDAEPFLRMTQQQATRTILGELRRLFPSRHIPEPEFVAIYSWSAAASFWVPCGLTNTNPPELRRDVTKLGKKGLFIAGEWCTVHMQTWMEGALESVDECGLY